MNRAGDQAVQAYTIQRKKEEDHRIALDEVAGDPKLRAELDRWALSEDRSFKDVRVLLSTLHDVMWIDSGWNAISMADLMQTANVKAAYRRAVISAHPDKNQVCPPQQKFRAEYIFQALKESWRKFTSL